MFTPTLYCLLLPLNTHEVSQETGEEQKQKTETMHKPYKERRRTHRGVEGRNTPRTERRYSSRDTGNGSNLAAARIQKREP